MGEHTVREVLKRRSEDTQRAIQRRRELTARGRQRKAANLRVLALVLLLLLAVVAGYGGWLGHRVISRFNADREARALDRTAAALKLASTTEFLPNTLLAVLDPQFYNSGQATVSPVTRRLVMHYFPTAPQPAVNFMALVLQSRFTRNDILEAYINSAPIGSDAGRPVYGFAAASQAYFHLPFAQLQPQDIALLVGLAGKGLDPRRDPARARAVRQAVLDQDLQQGVLSQVQVDQLGRMPLDLAPES